MSTKNVTLKEKVNGVLGDTIFPATSTPNVYDPAKRQALSQTLVNTPDYETLGFAKFSTVRAYNIGDKVYKDNELYRFVSDKAAGEWDAAKVESWSIEQEIEEVDDAIRSLIPAQASADNKLADKAYVNDKVSTDTATFRGTFNLVTDLELTTEATQGQIATALGTAISGEDKNDYAFVQIPTSDATPTEIARIDRYKYTGLQWAFEYSLNNSGFTAEQWAAINSGITSSLVAAFGNKYDKPIGGIPKTDLANAVQTSLGKADTALQEADADERYLRLGSYSASTAVGLADNLRGRNIDSEAYLIRPTGGENNEVANGVASVLGMEGNSAVWNQLVKNGDYSQGTTNVVTFRGSVSVSNGVATYTYTTLSQSFGRNLLNITIQGHKYYVHARIKTPVAMSVRIISDYTNLFFTESSANAYKKIGVIVTAPSTASLQFGCVSVENGTSYMSEGEYVIDLTLLGIDNLTTSAQVEEWLAQHVGTKPYYAYNAGEILSAKTLGIKTYGQNLLNPTTKQAKLIPYTWIENGTTYSNKYTIKNVPSGATATFTPDNTGVAVTVDISGGTLDITSYGSGVLELSAATANTYVCIKWNGTKDDDVVPFEEHTQDFDVRKVYGKVSGEGEYIQCFPNGMRSASSVHDTLSASDAVVKIKRVNLGDLNWNYVSKLFASDGVSTLSENPGKSNGNCISSKYTEGVHSGALSDKTIVLGNNNFGATWLVVKDTSYTDATTFKTAMNGVMLNYELATPITYTDLIYRDGGIDRPLADVLMNITVNNWSMEEQLLTPYVDGNPTSIPATIKTQYGMDAVEAIDTLQKTCYFADDVKANLQALLTCVNTNCAETLGGTFAISDTATDKVFAFTFTPNTEPDVEPTNEGE